MPVALLAAVMVLVVIAGYAVVGWVLQGLRLRGRPVPWTAAGLVITFAALLGSRTVKRNRDYRSRVAIWRDVVDQCPNNARAHNNLGEALASQGWLDEAISHFQAALGINPNQAGAHGNLGGALTAKGRPDDAIEQFREGIRLSPRNVIARCNLAAVLASQGRRREALELVREASEIDPNHAAVRRIRAALRE